MSRPCGTRVCSQQPEPAAPPSGSGARFLKLPGDPDQVLSIRKWRIVGVEFLSADLAGIDAHDEPSSVAGVSELVHEHSNATTSLLIAEDLKTPGHG
jgi:hypothetical protein